jgi:hypothetical protein
MGKPRSRPRLNSLELLNSWLPACVAQGLPRVRPFCAARTPRVQVQDIGNTIGSRHR